MFQVRRKLTLLTAVLAAVGYIIRNYDIEGLEAIRIHERAFFPTDFDSHSTSPAGTYVSTQHFPQSLPSTNRSATEIAPMRGFNPSARSQDFYTATNIATRTKNVSTENHGQDLALGLSTAERMTVWQESQVQPAISSSAATPSSTLGSQGEFKTIRIASFNLHDFGTAKRAKNHVMEMIIQLIRPFDVIALQEITSGQDDILPELCERMTQSGRQFDYLIGPRVGRRERKQFAILFETNRVETDRFQLYTVDDPHDLMNSEPLVGWFRAKGVSADQAFTFSLVNYQSEFHFAEHEINLLPDLIHAIENDGRNEDDWIFAGDFGVSDTRLASLSETGLRLALRSVPTTTRGNQMLDNILFSNQATGEFTGRAGVVDFLRKQNLNLEQALEVSDHLPVWAEFTTHEGGLIGRVGH